MSSQFVISASFIILSFVKVSDGFCPLSCECNEVALSVSCASSELEVLPITLNPGIQRLQLQRNNIRAVDAALGFYAQLQYLDMSNNQLISLPDRGFIAQKKLIELRLSNNKIFKVTNSTFDGLKTVTILSLRKNFIEELSDKIFIGLGSVEELDLGQNRISDIGSETFHGLDHLRVLYLDDNDLQQVPSEALEALPHLAELNLALNNIKILADNSFSAIVNLYSLDLQGCSIENISMEAFHSLETLRVLKLSANKLSRVPTLQLEKLERLEELTLGKNYFEKIPDAAFRGLRKLKLLDLSECSELVLLSSGALVDNINLSWISLSGNRQVHISPGSLSSLSQLSHVQLADMQWTSVDRDLLQWSGLTFLDLNYNPLQCDCHLAWLQEVMQTVGNQSKATCEDGQHVRDVDPDMMACSQGTWTNQTLLACACVMAGILTALSIVVIVHCQKKVCHMWKCHVCCNNSISGTCQECFESDCDKYSCSPTTASVSHDSTVQDNLYYTDTCSHVSIPRVSELYYPSSTKSTYCEDDYFLSLSKDRKTFKPIRVCEL